MGLCKLIKLVEKGELDELVVLAKAVKKAMLSEGLQQWIGDYPNYDVFLKDYEKHGLYGYYLDDRLIAAIAILPENDLAYQEVKWDSDKALVIHRIMVNPLFQKMGIAKKLFDYAIGMVKDLDYQAIKIDTHPDNIKMQKLVESYSFVYRGYLSSINRLAYELVVK